MLGLAVMVGGPLWQPREWKGGPRTSPASRGNVLQATGKLALSGHAAPPRNERGEKKRDGSPALQANGGGGGGHEGSAKGVE